MLPVMYTEGVHKGRISLKRMVEVCCTKPAKVSGLYPQKGEIRIGSDADLVIVDNKTMRPCRAKDLLTSCDFTVFEGRELTGWPVMTLLRGQVIFRDGKVVGKPGVGRYLPRTS
jgi:dihydropyrimidinase